MFSCPHALTRVRLPVRFPAFRGLLINSILTQHYTRPRLTPLLSIITENINTESYLSEKSVRCFFDCVCKWRVQMACTCLAAMFLASKCTCAQCDQIFLEAITTSGHIKLLHWAKNYHGISYQRISYFCILLHAMFAPKLQNCADKADR